MLSIHTPRPKIHLLQMYGIFVLDRVCFFFPFCFCFLIFSYCLIESMLAFLITALTLLRKASLRLMLRLGLVFPLKLLASYLPSQVKHEQTKQT